ncbi:hypothetical protein LJC45_02645 [Alistipes sp. OttesenSCG-928-B03]|nr:hypothetical protein [Alistipes sp. OttesenSCG-928-B03]
MKKFFYLAMAVCTLGFAACNDDDNDKEKAPAKMEISSGTVTGDAVTDIVKVRATAEEFGIAAVEPTRSTASKDATEDSQEPVIAENQLASVDFTDGAFSMTLPAETALTTLTSLFPEGVPTGIKATNDKVKAFRAKFVALDAQGNEIGMLFNVSETVEVLYLYADDACNITGEINDITLEIKAIKGWNKIFNVYTVTGEGEEKTSTLTKITTNNQSGTAWYFAAAQVPAPAE